MEDCWQVEWGQTAEDVAMLCTQGITINLDTEPVKENMDIPKVVVFEEGTWSKPSFCQRAIAGHKKPKGKWTNHPWPNVKDYPELKLFMVAFPMKYLKEVVLPETNKQLIILKEPITLLKLIQFLGCIFLCPAIWVYLIVTFGGALLPSPCRLGHHFVLTITSPVITSPVIISS